MKVRPEFCVVLLLVASAMACFPGPKWTVTCIDFNLYIHTITCHPSTKVKKIKKQCAERINRDLKELGLDNVIFGSNGQNRKERLSDDKSLESYNVLNGATLALVDLKNK